MVKKIIKNRYSVNTKKLLLLNKVFNKLKKHLPKSYHNIQIGPCYTDLLGIYNTYQGGYAVDSTIIVGTEYLNRIKGEISLVEILAHELGHHVLGRVMLESDDDMPPLGERDADHFGMMLCELAGYSRRSYIDWFKEFEERRKSTLSKKHIKEHGTGEQRIKQLEEQHKYCNEWEHIE